MKQAVVIVASVLTMLAAAMAVSAAPTDEQILAAAASPSANLAAALQDADAAQAAEVARQVAEKILSLGLSAEEQSARLAELIQILFKLMPKEQYAALASALGTALSGSILVSGDVGAMEAIRSALLEAGGEAGASLQAAFDQNASSGGQGTSLLLQPQPPEPEPEPEEPAPQSPQPRTRSFTPPQAPTYEGQAIPE